jgi:hypothetical protein
MEDNSKSLESLLGRAVDYGKTTYELAKLQALEKTSDVVSKLIPDIVVIVLIASFMLFLSLGLSLWLGEIFGKVWFGFFMVAAFYGVAAIVLRFLMYKWLKRCIGNSVIKNVLK